MTAYLTRASTSAYVDAARTTASPAQLLCLVYDRLLLDLERADANLVAGISPHMHLVHAQDIVMELLSTLDRSVWDGAQGLAGIYVYLHTQLVNANVRRDAELVAECRRLVAPLRDAWHAAAGGTLSSTVAPTPNAVADITRRAPMTPLSA
jgi:flagellar protein FliS